MGDGGKRVAYPWLGGWMNFLLNMNVHREMAAPLKKRGHVCRHVGDIGMARARDVDIIAEAQKTG